MESEQEPEDWARGFKSITMDRDLGERFMSQIRENASSVLELSRQWNEYDKEMELKEESVRNQIVELEKKEERLRLVEEREKKIELLEASVIERLGVLQEKEKDSDLKHSLETDVMRLVLETQNEQLLTQRKAQDKLLQDSMIKKHEELMRELGVRKEELEARQEELEKKEENFQMKQKAEAREIESKSKLLELKEKKLDERVKDLELKQRVLDQRSRQAETRKRSRLQFEPSVLAEKARDSAHVLHGKTSSDHASATTSQAKRREVNEIVYIDDEVDEDPEPYNCPDPDFNDFNNTMSSFSVGQVWALYDPLDSMPRYYAQIRTILKPQLSVQVKWLEPVETTENEEPIPIACGRFKCGDSDIQSHLMFSHEMHHQIQRGKNVTMINPRKGETWALFRDWTKSWISSHREQHEPPYRYDFVEVVSEFDSDQGIAVAYLGRVAGFTSVYKLGEQRGLIQTMVSSDEMLRFSHRVPSFKLSGGEKEGVPAGSFELDPAAIPRACLKAAKVKDEKIRP